MIENRIDALARDLLAIRKLGGGLPVMAIWWIQLQHPLYSEQLAYLDDDLSRLQSSLSLRSQLRTLLNTLRKVVGASLRLIRLRLESGSKLGELRTLRFDIIAKTWCFGTARADAPTDFYYGDIAQVAEKHGRSVLLLCGDTYRGDAVEFSEALSRTEVPHRISEALLLSALDPLRMFIRQLKSWVRLRSVGRSLKGELARTLCRRAAADLLSWQVTINGTYCWIGRRSVAIWRPKSAITLYEGRSWERCFWRGVANARSRCRIVGYQHAVVYPYAKALLEPQEDGMGPASPSLVLSLGRRTKEMMAIGHRSLSTNLLLFGSFRRTDDEPLVLPAPERKTVLVMPEGYPEEAVRLFDFAMEVAEALPDQKFVLRCHPALPFDRVATHLARPLDELTNVEVSPHKDVARDLDRSSIVLYRGTSAVLYTVLKGIKPLYYAVPGSQEIDPLYELDCWRTRVSDIQMAIETLVEYGRAGSDNVVREWQVAVSYVNEYTIPARADSVIGRLCAWPSSVGLSCAQE